ncbi:MAG: hypothetical protein K5907_10360 [Treponema sp.]|nr:hypothetical protein [Treponema sp.]
MKVESESLSKEEISKIRDAVKNRQPVDFYCYTLSLEQKQRFQEILNVFLDACNEADLFNCLSYCLFELLDNASKANAKRIFFQEQHLNINDSKDYSNGMKNFRDNLSDNTEHYKNELASGKLQVHLQLSADDVICVSVSNNTKITTEEYNRIQTKIQKTRAYKDVSDAFTDIDQTEGSGLGLITIVIMLKKLGLDTNCLNFSTSDDETIASIIIPKENLIDLSEVDDLDEL